MVPDQNVSELLRTNPDNEDHLRSLVSQFGTRSGVLPFVGAGMSRPFDFPLWDDFLLKLAGVAGITEEITQRVHDSQYEEAASELLEVLQPRRFQDALEKHFGDHVITGRRLTGAITELTRFPSGPIVTTNFDRVLETAFEQAGEKLTAFWHSLASKGTEALQQGKSFLLKLHGDWTDQTTRVLTLDEYKKAYGDITAGQIDFGLAIPVLLFTLLSGRCCLFLGCSLRQDRTVQLLKTIARGLPDLVHYAIVEEPQLKNDWHIRAAELSAQSIRPIWYPHGRHDLIQPLLAYLAGQAKTGPGAAKSKELKAVPGIKDVPNNIPELANPTVGRQEEMQQILGMLRGTRLLTITGVGGSGKSRLAVEIANALKAHFENGVWFIPLADLAKKADKERVLPTRIGKILGVPEQAGRPPHEALAEHLAAGRCLIVLDNCEHLIESSQDIAAYLLQRCLDLTILTTSRRPLKLAQERLYPLAPLKTPELDVVDFDQIRQNESVRLFVERARQRTPTFELQPASIMAVAEVCRALDGIPLAIEVAASRLSVKSVEQMSLESRDLLSTIGGIRSGDLRRWKTLTAALKWSYELLRQHEQLFMRSLAVFDGGWTEEEAAAVYRRPVTDSVAVLDHLQALHENSLLISSDVGGVKRFRFLEPVRQLAQSRLTPEERIECGRLHAAFFLSLAERAAPELLKSNQSSSLDKLQIEVDNLRAALRWSVQTANADVGLRLMAALWRFAEIRGYLTEGRDRAADVLSIPGVEQFPQYRSRVMSGAGMLAYRQADFEAAERMFTESLGIEETLGSSAGVANALNDLGNIAKMKGDYGRARELLSRSLAIEKQNKNYRAIAVAHYNLGSIALAAGEHEEAQRLLEESARGFRQGGNERELGFPLNDLAQVAISTNDLARARGYAGESLTVRKKLKDTKGTADALRTLGWASIEGQDFARAGEELSESLSLARGVGDLRGMSETLELFGLLYFRQKQAARAIELLAAAEQIRRGFHYARPAVRVSHCEDAMKAAKASVGEEEYGNAWRRGASFTISDAINAALTEK
jgi:predicted ATPase